MANRKAALLSVSDRTGLADFAKVLQGAGFTLLATSGTTKFLSEQGIETLPIENYTGQKEILDGRVKTLHPKIHAGLLAKRDNPEHLQELETEEILPIDVAVVNLYPFVQNLSSQNVKNPTKMTELIDIGGPTMIRAAAKNFKFVLPVIDPADYAPVGEFLSGKKTYSKGEELDFRRKLSVKVFTKIAHYNLEIAKYLSHVSFSGTGAEIISVVDDADDFQMGETAGSVLTRVQTLRYGENPHQKAALYRDLSANEKSWEQLNGKDLSYNNLLDFDAALSLIRTLSGQKPSVAIIKHLNPCGAACGETLLDALTRAKRSDPRSHFGGVLAFSEIVTADVAQAIKEDFAEIVLAPDFAPEAIALFAANKNLRVIKVPALGTAKSGHYSTRVVEGGVLIQANDLKLSDVSEATQSSKRKPTATELEDLTFAWKVCAHAKSNAIVIVEGGTVLGVGAGQMSRIDSVELALSKAATHGHNVTGSVCASDAFFPFPDSVETLGKAGVTAIITPSGAKRDGDAVAAADGKNMALLFACDRHFRH